MIPIPPDGYRTVLGGWSGAVLIATPHGIIKAATDPTQRLRVNAQASFFKDFACSVLPEVLAHGDGWYLMPRYLSHSHFLPRVIAKLTLEGLHTLWRENMSKAPVDDLRYDWMHRIRNHYAHLNSDGIMDVLLEKMSKGSSPVVLTHGDPTPDNVLVSERGGPILIDPLPFGVLPPLRAVDLGKMLQGSLLHGRSGIWFEPEVAAVALDGLDERERIMAWSFCALHLLRIIPYRPDLKRNLLMLARDVIMWHRPEDELLKKWSPSQ